MGGGGGGGDWTAGLVPWCWRRRWRTVGRTDVTAASHRQFEAVNMKSLILVTLAGPLSPSPCLVECVGQEADKVVFLETGGQVTRADEGAGRAGVLTLLQPDREIWRVPGWF